MPLEVVVELQIRAISCPGVFLPDKQDVYLGVYLLNQYLETDCFPSVFPIMIQQSMRFEKVFENAIDPGAVAEILESFLTRFELIQLVSPAWEELACYEENTRDFLFPEPKLTPSLPGMYRQVLMKTFAGFPGIAPQIEFSTRTAIRERVFLHRNRFLEEREKSRRPLSTSDGPRSPLNNVDSAKPFGDNISELQPRKSSTKPKFSNLPFPGRRASSFDSFAANIKVIKEPDERIVLRKESPSPLDSSKFGKPSPSYAPSPRKIPPLFSVHLEEDPREGVRSSDNPQSSATPKQVEYTISETKYILERPSYPLKKYPVQEQRYF
ncbi:spermatogenesis associated 6-like protein isoform X1 [Prionailurus iriomotensis]